MADSVRFHADQVAGICNVDWRIGFAGLDILVLKPMSALKKAQRDPHL
jgi:hypothetical protein